MVDSKIIISAPVFEYLKPTIFFMRVFGLAPISYHQIKKYYVVERSKKYIFYSYAFGIILSFVTVLGLVNDAVSENSLRMNLPNNKLVVISDIGIIVCSVLFGILVSPYKLNQLLNLLQCFHKINSIMNESKNQLKKEKRVVLTIALTVYTIFLLVFTLDIYSWMDRFKRKEDGARYFKYYFPFYIMYLAVMSQELSYCNFTYYVKKRIIGLNSAIQQEINRKPDVFLQKTDVKKTPDSKLLIGSEGDVLENYILTGKTYSTINELTPQKISNFIRVHAEIFTSVNYINDCFGYPLLFIMTSCLLHLVITPFLFITGNNYRPLFICLQILWISVHIGRLFIIVEPTHRCLEEYEKTNPLVVHLLSKVENKEVKQKVDP
ncbi:gustatory receptor for sugar taste 43a-like [Harmonia axyridis]|uniref:gustatory receptor for sugar taste 43a-like n=1 Tax=Harmonia axyridis TaxID=115357 RepID=UPI001E27619A|nr:gustatory receptor for sugar taste 43a-like [Harmonia axyridis]